MQSQYEHESGALRDAEHERSYVEYRMNDTAYRERVTQSRNHVSSLSETVACDERLWAEASRNADNDMQRRMAGELRSELVRKRTSLETASQEYERYVVMNTDALRVRYREIRAIPRVLDMWMDGDVMHIMTDVLFGKDKERKWHRVAPYLIKANLKHFNSYEETYSNSIPNLAWRNLECPKKKGANEHHAPLRIQGQYMNTTCLGMAKRPLRDALEFGDDVTLVKILVRIPECHGQDDDITLWPEVNIADVPPWYLDTFGH